MTRSLVAAALVASGCGLRPFEPPAAGADECNPVDTAGSTAVGVRMAIGEEAGDFFASPFPSIARTADCSLDAHRYPAGSLLLQRLRELTAREGYALSAGVFFELTGAPDPARFPAPFARPAATPAPSVLVFRLDPGPGRLALHPVNVESSTPRHVGEGARARPPHLLSVLPVQGLPFQPNATYVAAVTRSLAAGAGGARADACGVERLVPTCARDAYIQALAALSSDFGLPCAEIAGLAVFRTGDPTAELRAVFASARADFDLPPLRRDVPLAVDRARCPGSPICTFVGAVDLPQYQEGPPPFAPYLHWGGGWRKPDPRTGLLAPTGTARARVVLTLPRGAPAPPGGFPVVVLVRAGAGGTVDPLLDRGPIRPPGCGFGACGGPADLYAAAGYAALTVDGPLVGASRTDPLLANEDLAIYNLLNPLALRDNLRQSALELALVPELIGRLRFDATACGGLDPRAALDGERLVLFGHSMGGAIAPLALAVQPKYRAAIFSGSGGSYVLKAIYQQLPVPLLAAASLFGYSGSCRPHARDPEVSLLQWALEPSDAQVYAAPAAQGRHILMVQGVTDHYNRPPIADTFILGAGLDLALTPQACGGRADCDVAPATDDCSAGAAAADYPSIERLLALTSRRAIDLPAQGNLVAPDGRRFTSVVVQHGALPRSGCPCVDGHEVAYEADLARHQQECFLAGLAGGGVPRVPAGGELFGACE